MTFSDALDALKDGHRVSREGWNGKGMWVVLVRAESVMYRDDIQGRVATGAHDPSASKALPASFIAMKTADDKFVPWLPSQTDLFAEDWCAA